VNFYEYQSGAESTAMYPAEIGLAYVTLGLAGEAGEIANKVKKVYRDQQGVPTAETVEKLADELGDVLWYCAMLASELGYNLADVASRNYEKLMSRKERGVIRGDGDNR
jgi:NTP pyrophosphatase (non-canonical NTP hydrolase)